MVCLVWEKKRAQKTRQVIETNNAEKDSGYYPGLYFRCLMITEGTSRQRMDRERNWNVVDEVQNNAMPLTAPYTHEVCAD